jgi:hypothetical protein
MDGEGMQLVEAEQVPPAGRQARGLRVGVEGAVEARSAEEGEHRQVGEAMTAMCRGVDEHDTVPRVQDVAGPEVTMEPGRRSSVVEVTTREDVAEPIEPLRRRRV